MSSMNRLGMPVYAGSRKSWKVSTIQSTVTLQVLAERITPVRNAEPDTNVPTSLSKHSLNTRCRVVGEHSVHTSILLVLGVLIRHFLYFSAFDSLSVFQLKLWITETFIWRWILIRSNFPVFEDFLILATLLRLSGLRPQQVQTGLFFRVFCPDIVSQVMMKKH